jgi:hypothetical protein
MILNYKIVYITEIKFVSSNLFTIIFQGGVRFMVFNATFNNISVIYRGGPVLSMEETGVPGENNQPAASH